MKKPVKPVPLAKPAAPVKGAAKPAAKAAPHSAAAKAAAARRHAAAVKGAKTRAANAGKLKRHATARKHAKVQLAPGGGVACCAAEALAASLRLAGQPADDDDVLALYWRTAGDPGEGASIPETLAAAARYGLAGCRPGFAPAGLSPGAVLLAGVLLPQPHAVLVTPAGWWSWGELWEPFPAAVPLEAWEVTW